MLPVRADTDRAKEDIARLRREEEARGVHVRVQTETARAEERVDRMRAEQEARPIHIRVNTDENRIAGLSRAVESARRQVISANEAIVASERRVDGARRASANAADAITASDRRVDNARQQVEIQNTAVTASERRLADLRQSHASEINPLVIAAENALQRARAKGDPEGIARNERNLAEMRKALAAPTHDIARAEDAVATARHRQQVAVNNLAQAEAAGVGVRRRAEQAEQNVTQALDNGTAARRRAQQAGENLSTTIDNEIKKSRDLSRELQAVGKDFPKAFPLATGLLEGFSSLAPVIGMLPALATGLAEAAAAAEQLAGASLALPGVFAGIGASLGTLLVGVQGITEAYQALGRQAASSGEDQRQHAIEVRQANESLTSATREQTLAERERSRAVRDSRQEQEDLNLQLRGGQISTAEAILEAQKARRDLATGTYKDGLDYQSAQLRVLQADQRVAESANNQNKLRTRQADIGDRVQNANDRVAASNQRVADAMQHLADVNTKVSASSRAANIAMSHLAPNAQEFVKTIFDLVHSGPLHDLEMSTGQNLFAGMSTSIKQLVAADLPTLSAGMGKVATSLNTDFKALFASLGSDHSKGVLAAIFGDTAHAQDLLKNAINPIVDAFGTLARAGADVLPRMADGIGRASERFSKFIDAADKDGRLDAWINGGITGFTHLGNIFINLGKSVDAISKALGGQGLLATLEDATKKLADFLNSTKGQDDLRRIFADGRRELDQLKPILEALPGIFKSVFGAARDAVGGWLPVLQTAAGILKDWPGLTRGILDGFLAWKTLSGPFSLVSDGLTLLATKTGSIGREITNSRVLADKEMSTTAKIFQKVAGEEGVAKLTGALNTLSGLAGPVGLAAVTAAIPLAEAAFDKLTTKTRQAADAANQLDQQERTLEQTLDRVSGKITAATRDQTIDALKNYNQSGAGGGIAGISQGDAITAAGKLGIPPDVYTNAALGDPSAIQQVKDILFKNNLGPEFQANKALKGDVGAIAGYGLSQEDLLNALIGSPGAVENYTNKIKQATGSSPEGTDLDLTHIAQQLSPTGQASVLSGLALTHQQSVISQAQQGHQQTQQAQQGRWRLSSTGTQDFGLTNATQVNADDNGFTVTVPASGMSAALQDKLKQLGITPDQLPYGQGWTFVLPKGSPDVEKYEQGGGTPSAPGPLPGGGYHAIIHPEEYVANATGRATLGDDFLAAANKGDIDLSKLPHFDDGGPGGKPEFGPTDQQDAQQQQQGGLLPAVQSGISGGVNALQQGWAALQQGMPGDQGEKTAGPAGGGRFGGVSGFGLYGLLAGQMPQFQAGGPGDIHTGTGMPTVPGLPGGPLPALPAAGDDIHTLPGIPAAGTTPGAEIAGSVPGVPGTSRFAGMPGLWGLIGVNQSSDPGAAMQAWTGQTQNYLTKWGLNFLSNAASIGYGGLLGGLGLDKSILSPSNQWTSAGIQGITGALQHMAPGDPDAAKFSAVLSSLSGFGGLTSTSGSGLGTELNTLLSPQGAANPAVSGFLQTGGLDTNASGIPGLNSTLQSLGLAGLVGGDGSGGPGGNTAMPGASITYTPAAVTKLGIAPLAINPQGGGSPTLPGWLTSFVKQFGPSLTPTSTPHGALHGTPGSPEWATDVVGSAQEMDTLAAYLKAHPSLSIQLIHKSQITGQDYGIAGGADVSGGYYTTPGGTYEDELTMVHWAPAGPVTTVVPTGAAGPGAPGGVNPAALTGGLSWWQGWKPGNASGPIPGASGHGDARLQQIAQAMYLQAGMPPGEWNDFDELIAHESGWNPTAQNPGSTAYGLGQFLNSTWASVGGSKTSDPVRQLGYIFSYLKQRSDYHGSPAAAWSLWNARSPHWYDAGEFSGPLQPGLTLAMNNTGKNETVLTHEQTQTVNQALSTTAAQINSSNASGRSDAANPRLTPSYQVPDAQQMQPRSTAQAPQGPLGPGGAHMLAPTPQPTSAAPGGAPGGQPAPPAALGPLGPEAQPATGTPTVHGAGPGEAQGAWSEDSGMHVAPALKTGIMSGAQAIGQGVSTALGIAGGAASMASFGGGAALSAIGPYVSGLIQEGGKIVVDAVNVPSSLMVGTLTPGTTANPSGQTYHPQQEQRPTASVRQTNYGGFYGHNTEDVLDALDLRESQQQQSHLANYRSWP